MIQNKHHPWHNVTARKLTSFLLLKSTITQKHIKYIKSDYLTTSITAAGYSIKAKQENDLIPKDLHKLKCLSWWQ